MNEKITELIKGRSDGMEILDALDITESTKFCSKVEKAIKSTIELVDQKMSVTDAAAQFKGKAKPSAIATQQSTAIASPPKGQQIPGNAKEVIDRVARKFGQEDKPKLPRLIAEGTHRAKTLSQDGTVNIAMEGYFAGLTEDILSPEFETQVVAELAKLEELDGTAAVS